jgi:hypothetical protein
MEAELVNLLDIQGDNYVRIAGPSAANARVVWARHFPAII